MASFTETATLKVINGASKEIRTINKDLQKLLKTADNLKKSLRNIGPIKVQTGQLTQANRKLLQLGTSAKSVRKELQLTGSIKMQSLNSALTRLKALETQANSTARAVAKIGQGVRTHRGRPGNLPPGQNNNPQRVTVEYGGLRGFLNGFATRLGTTIESAIISGFAKGGRTVDLAQNRQRVLGFTPEQRAANNKTATEIVNRNRGFSRGQVLGVMGEITPSVGNDPEATAFITEAILDYSRALMVAGATSEEATNNLQKLSKAMGMTSTLLDNEGKFDKEATQRFIDVLVQETITGGAEMTPELIAQLAKYSRTTGKTLNQEGWRTLLFLGEDYGSSAGVGLNQMIKQLTGERVQKKQLVNQMGYGITGSKEIVTGKVGGKKKTELVSTGVQDEKLLRSDPAQWIEKILLPIMEKQGIDITDNTAVAKFAGEITSDRTATDILTTMITNLGEIKQRRGIAEARGDVDLKAVMEDSLVNRWDDATTQLVSAAGEVTNSFKGVLIPALNLVSDTARGIAAFIAGDGNGNLGVAAMATGGAAVTGFAAWKAGSGLLNGFGLGASATALNGSAAALTRAALMLGGAAPGASTGGVVGDMLGGKNPGGNKWVKGLKFLGFLSAWVGGAVIADQALNDGKLTKQAEDNVQLGLAVQEAVTKVVQDKLMPEGEKQNWEKIYDWFASKVGTDTPVNQEAWNNFATEFPPAFAATMNEENTLAAENFRGAFQEGSTRMAESITGSATQFGTEAGAALSSGGTAFGQAAANAFNAAVAPVAANINVNGGGPDTGQNANGAR